MIEVSFLSSRGRINVRGERWGGGNCEKFEDVVDVTDEERRVGGDKGDVGRGISLGENIISSLSMRACISKLSETKESIKRWEAKHQQCGNDDAGRDRVLGDTTVYLEVSITLSLVYIILSSSLSSGLKHAQAANIEAITNPSEFPLSVATKQPFANVQRSIQRRQAVRCPRALILVGTSQLRLG